MAEVVAAAFGGDRQHHSGLPRRLDGVAPVRPARVGKDRKCRADLAFQVVPSPGDTCNLVEPYRYTPTTSRARRWASGSLRPGSGRTIWPAW